MRRLKRLAAACAISAMVGLLGVAGPADARDDIIWQHANGTVHYWPIRNGARVSGLDLGGTGPIGPEWSLRAAGDLNGDGTKDIIWQHANGQVHWWPMRAGVRLGGADVGANGPVGPEWRLVGAGDLNGDGTDDIVWRHANGQMHWWPIRNGARVSGADIGASVRVGAEWTVVGVGDLNGDRTDDIVWRHANGQVHWWPIRNGGRVSGADIGASGPVGREWSVRGVGDMNADGTDDIVWQHANGQVHWWTIRNGSRLSGQDIAASGPVGPEWSLRAVGHIGDNEPINTVHSFGISRFTSTALTNADADRILADASRVLQGVDAAGDVACAVEMRREGNVGVFTAGNGTVTSQAQFTQVLDQRGSIHVVNAITWCRGPGASIIGCAPVPGGDLAVVRYTPATEGILWAHEFGHNQGLPHRNGNANVMNPVLVGTARGVNAAECTAFRSPRRATRGGNAPVVVSAAGGVDSFARQHYFHGIPYAEAARFTEADLPRLQAILNNPAEREYWSNAVGIMGAIGGANAAQTLTQFVRTHEARTLDPDTYRAAHSAMIGLGYAANKGEASALAFLSERARALSTTAPAAASETLRLDAYALNQTAVLGLAVSARPEAQQLLRTLPQDQNGVVRDSITISDQIRLQGLREFDTQRLRQLQ